jgi:hypothetical protein
MAWYGLVRSGSVKGPVEGSCEHGDEPSGSLEFCEVPEWLQNWQLLRKGSAPYVSEYLVGNMFDLIRNISN